MGCFLGCFGAAEDRKLRKRKGKPRVRSSVERHGSPRFSSVTEPCEKPANVPPRTSSFLESPEKTATLEFMLSLASEPPEKQSPSKGILHSGAPVNKLSLSPRKRVTFDTNVQTYEHDDREPLNNPAQDNVNTGGGEKRAKPSHSESSCDSSSEASSSGSFPPNHRYQNCRESDDELDYCDSDTDDDDDDDDDEAFELSDDDEDYDGVVKDKSREVKDDYELLDSSSNNMRLQSEMHNNLGARCRGVYSTAVLNPVENLTQWKAIKSKGRNSQVKSEKENLDKYQEPQSSQHIFHGGSHENSGKPKYTQEAEIEQFAVDASLSTWLSSSTARASITSSVNLDVRTPERNGSCGSISPRNLEDRPILGALTADEIRKFSASKSPKKSPLRRSPDDTPIIGSVGSYWSTASKGSGSVSSFKGIPNTTSKYSEDKRVKWHSTPFETRLERALTELSDDGEGLSV